MFFDYYNGWNFIKGCKVIKMDFYLFSSFSYFSISICALPRLLAVSPYLYGQTLSVWFCAIERLEFDASKMFNYRVYANLRRHRVPNTSFEVRILRPGRFSQSDSSPSIRRKSYVPKCLQTRKWFFSLKMADRGWTLSTRFYRTALFCMFSFVRHPKKGGLNAKD